ncbi:MAG: ATP-binding protein [Phycisphaerales bacterium]
MLRQFLPRHSSMISGVLVMNTAIVACAMAALWIVVGWVRQDEAIRAGDRAASVVAEMVRPDIEKAFADQDVASARLALAKAAHAGALTGCRISLGDGAVVADLDASAVTSKTIPTELPPLTIAPDSHHTFAIDIRGKGKVLLTVEAGGATARSEWLEYGFGGVCLGAIVLLGVVSVRAQKHAMPVTLVQSALNSVQAGEKELAALELTDSFGAIANAWNGMLRELATHRARERFDSVVTRRSQPGERDEAVGKMVDSLWHGVVAVDDEMRIRYCNGAAAVFLSGTRDGLLGTPLLEHIQEAQAQEKLAKLAHSKGRGKVVVETRAGEGEGGAVLRISGRPTTGGGGAMLLIEDVTQQRVADRSRNAFVEQATHELRTPLTNVRLYVEALVEKPDADVSTRSQHLNIINQEVRRLERIVGDMLSVSEIEAGTLKLAVHDIRLPALFTDLEAEFAAPARAKNITLRFDLPPKLPTIVGDRDKFVLALTNVVGNAIKYTPEGGTVKVGVRADDALVIDVADSGIGIAAEDVDRIFDRFYRAKDPRVEKIVGTGLGLALAREVMRLHGGDVTVQSVPDRGSTFSIRMPLKAPLSMAA